MYKNYDCSIKGHASKILEQKSEKLLDGSDVIWITTLWGCVFCDAISETEWANDWHEEVDHTTCGGPDVCFGCKAKGLQLATGDAAGNIIASGTTQKKWDKELQLYRDAKAQGVQPAGTSTKAIRSALEASEVLNKPYDAGKMPATQHITKQTVEVMKEIGQI